MAERLVRLGHVCCDEAIIPFQLCLAFDFERISSLLKDRQRKKGTEASKDLLRAALSKAPNRVNAHRETWLLVLKLLLVMDLPVHTFGIDLVIHDTWH